MYLHKSTRYALHAALELALAGARPTTVKQVAARYELPENVVAKVLQQLAHSGVATGVRGVGGGYRLAQPAENISDQFLIDMFEPPPAQEGCRLREPLSGGFPEGPGQRSRLAGLFAEVEETVRSTFASVSLATLVAPSPDDQQVASPPPESS
jgi:Rrf2 family protein